MAGEILTPNLLWNSLVIEQVPEAQTIGEYKEGDVSLSRLRVDGRVVSDGQVKIYCVLARNVKKKKQPTLFILQKFTDGADETLAMELAKKGFCAFVVNLGGNDGVNNNYTLYPNSLSFANFKQTHIDMDTVTDDVKNTCWFEWGVTARYALKYLKSLPFVGALGGLGIYDSATVLWNMTVTNEFDAYAFILNAGWRAYKGNYKFTGTVDEEFSDDKIKYIAGIEPQSYASHVKAPTIISLATNSPDFDFERAHDTFARINPETYATINYTVGGIDCVDDVAFQNVLTFFEKTLVSKKTNELPEDASIKCEIENGVAIVSVSACEENLKSICIYASEETFDPAMRQWQKVTKHKKTGGKYIFKYLPFNQSGAVFFFAECVYKNGFVISSDVVAKKFAPNEVNFSHPSKILYSSREENAISAFYPAGANNKKPSGLLIKKGACVIEKKGPMDITGVTCESGLVSFKMGMKKFRPQDDGILLLDAHMTHGGMLTIKLVSNRNMEKIEYTTRAKVASGDIWNNLKFPINVFKSPEGRSISSMEKIDSIEISADNEYLINNALWV